MKNEHKSVEGGAEIAPSAASVEDLDDAQLPGHLRYARGLIRSAKRRGAAFVDINVEVLAYLVENRRKLSDRLRWAEQRAEQAGADRARPSMSRPSLDPVTTYTPMMWAAMNDDQRYEEYVRVLRLSAEARPSSAEIAMPTPECFVLDPEEKSDTRVDGPS